MKSQDVNITVFPQQVSDMLNLMHLIVFSGTDGEEKWDTYLTLAQKEYIALAVGEYYQCEHCIDHHLRAVSKLTGLDQNKISDFTNFSLLFFRADIENMRHKERNHWINAWISFSQRGSQITKEPIIPTLIGLAIGIARNDEFFISFFGSRAKKILINEGIDPKGAIGEVEAVVVFMKAASTKNRSSEAVDRLFKEVPQPLNPTITQAIRDTVTEAITEVVSQSMKHGRLDKFTPSDNSPYSNNQLFPPTLNKTMAG